MQTAQCLFLTMGHDCLRIGLQVDARCARAHGVELHSGVWKLRRRLAPHTVRADARHNCSDQLCMERPLIAQARI
jgi:hypothetical protein